MTDIPLNTYIDWTDEDRKRGECPVPAGSDVTVWFSDKTVDRDSIPQGWSWGGGAIGITGYLVHELPREPIVRWVWVDGPRPRPIAYEDREFVQELVKEYGGRIVKLVEVDDG